MLKRGTGSKASYSPYSTVQRVKKVDSKTKLDLLPNKANVWLKQLSILQEQPRKDGSDASSSSSSASFSTTSSLCPSAVEGSGTVSATHGKLVGCASPAGTLKRPTTLSRNASAAGSPIQSWVFSKGQGRAAIAQSPQTEAVEMPIAIEVEDIPPLLHAVARFAEAVEKLKDVVLE
ncbi:rho GTPase-activating protein 45 isoform X1, partial [Tachysurus ichikawai]